MAKEEIESDYAQRSLLFRNVGDGRFEELGAVSGETIDDLDAIEKQPDAVTAPELLTPERLPEVAP